MTKQRGPLEEIGGDWFVNRTEELDLFWQWATNIPAQVYNSYALIGLRRTGKTAILHQLFNRLFHEQTKVIPIYSSFARYLRRPKPITSYEFAEEYFSSFVRSYLAFQYREPELLQRRAAYEDLRTFAEAKADTRILAWFTSYERILNGRNAQTRSHSLMQWTINLPKGHAWGDEQPLVIIIDEFQVLTNVYNPDSNLLRVLTDSFQEASETHWAPLLVSGSSVSMMVDNALGGGLSGRFQTKHLGPLKQEYAYQMIFQLGQRNNITVTEEVALAIWEFTQGYPYSIERLLNSNSPEVKNLPSLEALQKILLYELTQEGGALLAHYDNEYGKYIRQLNGEGVTRRILLWTLHHPPEQLIHPSQVAEALSLPLETVMEKLQKLQRIDVLKRYGTGTYWGPADPLLRRYLKYEHDVTVEQLTPEAAAQNLRKEYNRLQGEMNRRIGHLAEIIVGGVMHSFDGSAVDGLTYFNTPGLVTLPKLSTLQRRSGVIQEGTPQEIDLIGEWRTPNTLEAMGESGVWLVSVRHRNEVMGEREVRKFLEQTAAWVSAKQQEKATAAPFEHLTRWYVSKLGFTQAAMQVLQAEGVYYSDLAQFNQLAVRFGFLPLKDDKRKGL